MEEREPIKFRIEEQGENYVFFSNAKIDNETIEYDLDSVKEIFELNPIPKKEIVEDGNTKEISYDVAYDVPNKQFLLQLKYDGAIEDSRIISLEEMLNILIDAYQNNTYITSNENLNKKINSMTRNKMDNLLKEGYVPNTEFLLKGEGIIKLNNEKVALFNRAYIIPDKNEIVALEIIGDIPEDAVNIEFDSTLGVKFVLNNVRLNKESYDKEKNKVIEIGYASFKSNGNLISNLLIDKIEEVKYETTLEILEDDLITTYTNKANKLMSEAIKILNKNSDELIMDYIKDKKSILYSTSEEDYLENQVNELFDDFDF